jgi:hypothetical protein
MKTHLVIALPLTLDGYFLHIRIKHCTQTNMLPFHENMLIDTGI